MQYMGACPGHYGTYTLGVPAGGGGGAWDLERRESRSPSAFEELAAEGPVDWERDEERAATLMEEGVELVEMGGASGMDAGCK